MTLGQYRKKKPYVHRLKLVRNTDFPSRWEGDLLKENKTLVLISFLHYPPVIIFIIHTLMLFSPYCTFSLHTNDLYLLLFLLHAVTPIYGGVVWLLAHLHEGSRILWYLGHFIFPGAAGIVVLKGLIKTEYKIQRKNLWILL